LSNERARCEIKLHAMRYGAFGKTIYIITDEVVHSSVLKVMTKEKSLYVMALTPYPNTRRVIITFRPPFIKIIRDLDRRFENPSILFSEDEISFTERNIQNPIYPSPKSAKRFKGPTIMIPILPGIQREKRFSCF